MSGLNGLAVFPDGAALEMLAGWHLPADPDVRRPALAGPGRTPGRAAGAPRPARAVRVRYGGENLALHVLGGPEYLLRTFVPGFDRRALPEDSPAWLEPVAPAEPVPEPGAGFRMDLLHRRLSLYVEPASLDYVATPGGALAFRRALLSATVRTWPGWQVRWAAGGARDLVDGLDLRWSPGPATVEDPGPARVGPTMLGVTDGRAVRVWTTWQRPERVIGSDAEAWRRRLAEVTDGLDVQGRHVSRTVLSMPEAPSSGVHVDLARRAVQWWASGTTGGGDPHELAARCGPGWQVRFRDDAYEEFTAACWPFLSLPAVDTSAADDAMAALLRRHGREPQRRR